MRSSSIWTDNSASTASPSSSFQQLVPPPMPMGTTDHPRPRQSNVFQLLARREVSPQTKRSTKRFWGKDSSLCKGSCRTRYESAKDARQELRSWVEAGSLLHISAKYCPLQPPPRSTIAAAFSPDGKTLASTHGDHTVKIINCQTGKCLKVLSGHRRTPWVVRFHPLYPDILASGSLDHEVRLWDAKTAECIGSRDFYRPIASIAFHAQGEILAVASGHKLYMWHYNRRGEASSPTIILKTRRSLRAVHFHPHAAPFLLTAEVNDLDSSDPSMTLATSPGYLHYPPPTIYLADAHSNYRSNSGNDVPIMSVPFLIWPSISTGDGASQQSDVDMSSSASQQRVDTSASVRLLTYSTPSGQYELVLSPVESSSSTTQDEQLNNSSTREIGNAVSQHAMDTDIPAEARSNQFFPFGDPANWELPFLQGWLIGQSQAGQRAMHSQNGGSNEGLPSHSAIGNLSTVVPPVIPSNIGNLRVPGRSGSRHQSSRTRAIPTTRSGDAAAFNNSRTVQINSQPFMNQIQSEVATSLAAAAAAELPCTVKLRIWSHDVKNPCAPLDTERCRLTIPHAVLCSEMGAHFSPCGRFLAVCVACVLPNMDADPGFHGQIHDVTGASTSPTRHPISAHRVMYELRIYSLEEATFGSVLVSRAIRAAHCLTSIQFSPTSEHLLLAYGRRHSSLLKSVVIDGDTTVPIYTILEIYRVSDMELVRVLPSAEDEVNVACFHPLVGGGLVYGTKEGKLRILQCDGSHGFNISGSCVPDDNMVEVPTFALEG
ncbi:Transducin family protein / WD-40 repeat family protein [Perilla frutescens var. hirtella]|nr:Transducin family protein / WD-40 repeat family protein [Perilla frutescens var. hirtella]